jgi:hypothetical protein
MQLLSRIDLHKLYHFQSTSLDHVPEKDLAIRRGPHD